MSKCNTLRRTENVTAYSNGRLALASRVRRGIFGGKVAAFGGIKERKSR